MAMFTWHIRQNLLSVVLPNAVLFLCPGALGVGAFPAVEDRGTGGVQRGRSSASAARHRPDPYSESPRHAPSADLPTSDLPTPSALHPAANPDIFSTRPLLPTPTSGADAHSTSAPASDPGPVLDLPTPSAIRGGGDVFGPGALPLPHAGTGAW
jgi:hypothetical protein